MLELHHLVAGVVLVGHEGVSLHDVVDPLQDLAAAHTRHCPGLPPGADHTDDTGQ